MSAQSQLCTKLMPHEDDLSRGEDYADNAEICLKGVFELEDPPYGPYRPFDTDIDLDGYEHIDFSHASRVEKLVSNVEESEINAATVHTPHSQYSSRKDRLIRLEMADYMARRLDADLVFDSMDLIACRLRDVLSDISLGSNPAFEPSAGENFKVYKGLLEQDDVPVENLTFDNAHYFASFQDDEEYYERLESLFDELGEKINVIHLNNINLPDRDGKPLFEGDEDIIKTYKRLREYLDELDHDISVVVETPVDSQRHDLEVMRALEQLSRDELEEQQDEIAEFLNETKRKA